MSPVNLSILISGIVSFSPSLAIILRFLNKLRKGKYSKNKVVSQRKKNRQETIESITLSPNTLKIDEIDSFGFIFDDISKSDLSSDNKSFFPENNIKTIDIE